MGLPDADLAPRLSTEPQDPLVSYDDLHAQLGSHYQTDEHGALTRTGKIEFGRSVRHALAAIRGAWPELDVATPRGRLVVRATGPDVEHRTPRHD